MATGEGRAGEGPPTKAPASSSLKNFVPSMVGANVEKAIPEQMLERSGEWKLGFVN